MNADWAAAAVERYLAAEDALRSMHGPECLYVRPQVWSNGTFPFAAAGWARLDGNPAILPHHLDLLVISGQQDMGRRPTRVVELLRPYIAAQRRPVPHLTVRVPQSDRARLLEQIARLPDHTPKYPSPPPRLVEHGGELSAADRESLELEASASRLARQRRLLPIDVPFHVVNQAMYQSGLRSTSVLTELEPDAVIYRANGGTGVESPEVVYSVDQALAIKKLEATWMAPRDVPQLPFVELGAIDLSPQLEPALLTRHLAQLKWLSAEHPGWAGVPGAVPVRGTSGSRTWYGYDTPVELRQRVDALRGHPAAPVATAADDLLKLWDAQASILRGR